MEGKERFEGLAFPVVRVRYAGPTDYRGSRWIATCVRGNDRKARVQVSYEDEQGKRQHFLAARKCWEKMHASLDIGPDEPRVFIPGDCSPSEYVFLVVPADYLETYADFMHEMRRYRDYVRTFNKPTPEGVKRAPSSRFTLAQRAP